MNAYQSIRIDLTLSSRFNSYRIDSIMKTLSQYSASLRTLSMPIIIDRSDREIFKVNTDTTCDMVEYVIKE